MTTEGIMLGDCWAKQASPHASTDRTQAQQAREVMTFPFFAGLLVSIYGAMAAIWSQQGDGCEIIVCWIHNWRECLKNIQVIEVEFDQEGSC